MGVGSEGGGGAQDTAWTLARVSGVDWACGRYSHGNQQAFAGWPKLK